MTTPLHPVLFVGAGPGDPELITVAGRKALEEADLIVFAGSLVSRDMLGWARPEAETVDSAGLDLEEIVGHLIRGHQNGRKVVRLHTGDPSLYGAVREQFARLEASGVPFRIIPGVSAVFAAAAALGIEYTLPEISQTLILTRMAGRTLVPEAENLKAWRPTRRAWPSIFRSDRPRPFPRPWPRLTGPRLQWPWSIGPLGRTNGLSGPRSGIWPGIWSGKASAGRR